VIDPALASCVPPGASAIAGLDLNRLRTSPLFPRIPLLEPLRDSTYALVVLSGSDLLVIAQGNFQQPPPGATLLNPHLALAGSPASVAAAAAQHRTGANGTPDLVQRAASNTVWIVARGSATFPLTGNAANLNRFLHYTDYTVLTADLASQAAIQVTATARNPEAATRFEESLRAWVSLAGVAAARQPELAAVLQSVQIRRDGTVVHAALTAAPDAIAKLLP
jgi:hypothetical protein